jgi:diguanylate cyclase (GGDEF)-like protein/PAS domain S-box-containing protein
MGQPDNATTEGMFAGINGPEVLADWLAKHPTALLGALNETGQPIPMPSGVPLGAHHTVEERSLLDLVVPDDMAAVTEGFVSALQRGFSVRRVHLASNPREPVLLHYLDARLSLGAVIRIVAAADPSDDGAAAIVSRPAATRPRLGFMTKDEISTIVSIDEACSLMLGWSREEMAGRRTIEFIHPDDHVRAIDNWMARFANKGRVGTVRLRYLRKDGSWLWVETANEQAVSDEGTAVVHSQLIDISTEMAATEALRRSEAIVRQVTDTVPVGLFHLAPDGALVFVNPIMQKMFGATRAQTRSELLSMLARGRETELERAIDRVLTDGADEEVEVEVGDPESGGAKSAWKISLCPISDDDMTVGVLGCVVDVTELRNIAHTDALTGLGNRRSIIRVLEDQLARGHDLSVIFVDLDNFKPVNDQFGHDVGDQVLATVAARLRNVIRSGDHVGRLGGDEFLITCPLLDHDAGTAMIDRITEIMQQPVTAGGHQLVITASVGISTATAGMSVDHLIAAADVAMYQEKRRHPHHCHPL